MIGQSNVNYFEWADILFFWIENLNKCESISNIYYPEHINRFFLKYTVLIIYEFDKTFWFIQSWDNGYIVF